MTENKTADRTDEEQKEDVNFPGRTRRTPRTDRDEGEVMEVRIVDDRKRNRFSTPLVATTPNPILVTFVEKYPPYNAGETVGFSEENAQRLVRLGIAVPEGMEPERLLETGGSQDATANKIARVTAAQFPGIGQSTDLLGRPVGGLSEDQLTADLRAVSAESQGELPRGDARLQNLRQLAVNPDNADMPEEEVEQVKDQERESAKGLSEQAKDKPETAEKAPSRPGQDKMEDGSTNTVKK